MITLQLLKPEFSVCKIERVTPEDLACEFCFVGKTDSEVSLVCQSDRVPAVTLAREDGWRGFRIVGTLDFSLVGILAPIAKILADAKIGIFAVSTYDTDYVFIKRENAERAAECLRTAGYAVI